MPVVAAALHSQVPAVAVAFKDAAPDARLAYVMTDGAGLPLAMSDLVADLRGAGSSTPPSRAATRSAATSRRCRSSPRWRWHATSPRADVGRRGDGARASSAPTPGSASAAWRSGPILDAAAALGGVPIACLRVSFADPRARHAGSVAPHADRAAAGVPRAGRGARCRASAAPRRPVCAPTSPRAGHRPPPRARRGRPARRARAVRASTGSRSCRWDAPARGRPRALPRRGAAAGGRWLPTGPDDR